MIELSSTMRQLLASYTAALGSWALGASIGWPSHLNKQIIDDYYKFPVTSDNYNWIIALLPLGAAIICIPIGFIMDVIGRKILMIIMMPPFAIAWILVIWPQNIYMLYGGRFMMGLCGGAFSVLVPVYSTEIAEVHQRGIMGSSYQVFLTMGILYAWTIGTIFNVLVMSILCGILPIIFIICICFLPESPVYWLQHNEWDRAINALHKVRGDYLDVYTDLREMAHYIHFINATSLPFYKAVGLKRTQRCLILATILMLFQQISGIDILLYNTYELLQSYTQTLMAKIDVILLGIAQVIIICINALLLIDRWGRRLLLMVAIFYSSLCCMTIGLFYRIWENNHKTAEQISWLVLIALIIYIIMYSIGLGAIPWLYNAEIFAHNVKGFGTSYAATLHWLMSFSLKFLYIYARNYLPFSTLFFIHTFILLIIFFFVLMFMPETKHKTFIEIQILMEHKFY